MSELDLIRWIRSRVGRRRDRVLVDTGDDAAVVSIGGRPVLFKTDSVVEGVHFDGNSARPEDIGHKAVARCLSDIAAMGCVPSFTVAALMVPRTRKGSWVRRLVLGMERTATAFKCPIVGGDVAVHPGKLAVTVSMLGESGGRAPVCRRGARVGDVLAVTGSLGGSILGKHLRFTPRVREGVALNRRFEIHAMIDLSDGLSTDLAHLCRESGVGAVLREDLLPISAAARRLARRDGDSALDHALRDGEDYELLFALPESQSRRLERCGLGTVIGEVTSLAGTYLWQKDGSLIEIMARGWEHRLKR